MPAERVLSGLFLRSGYRCEEHHRRFLRSLIMTCAVTRGPQAPARDQPRQRSALLIIDMISDFEFEGATTARKQLDDVVPRIRSLRQMADRAQAPVIYVNDNFGEWHSERSRLIERVRGIDVIQSILPRSSDYFVIKPQFSGFYATNLPVLLPKLGVDRVVLTGIATEMCIFVTAADAHMRDYGLWVPRNAVISVHMPHGEAALEIMQNSMRAHTESSADPQVVQWFDETGSRDESRSS